MAGDGPRKLHQASVTPDEPNQTYAPHSLSPRPTLVTRNNCQTRRRSFEKVACQASPRGFNYATVRWKSAELADRRRDEVSRCTTRSHNSLITMAMGKRKQTLGSVCEKEEPRKRDAVGVDDTATSRLCCATRGNVGKTNEGGMGPCHPSKPSFEPQFDFGYTMSGCTVVLVGGDWGPFASLVYRSTQVSHIGLQALE